MALGSTQSLTEMSTRNLPGSKGLPVGVYGWQPHRHLWADGLENVGASASHNPMGLRSLLEGQFYLYLYTLYRLTQLQARTWWWSRDDRNTPYTVMARTLKWKPLRTDGQTHSYMWELQTLIWSYFMPHTNSFYGYKLLPTKSYKSSKWSSKGLFCDRFAPKIKFTILFTVDPKYLILV
jgi:hypothetical protein